MNKMENFYNKENLYIGTINEGIEKTIEMMRSQGCEYPDWFLVELIKNKAIRSQSVGLFYEEEDRFILFNNELVPYSKNDISLVNFVKALDYFKEENLYEYQNEQGIIMIGMKNDEPLNNYFLDYNYKEKSKTEQVFEVTKKKNKSINRNRQQR